MFTEMFFAFLVGWGLRDVLGLLCIKGHMQRIERRLGLIAADRPEPATKTTRVARPDCFDRGTDDAAAVEAGAVEGGYPHADFAHLGEPPHIHFAGFGRPHGYPRG